MKQFKIHLVTVWLICLAAVNTSSQITSAIKIPEPVVFTGSTPCDPLIKSLLRIQTNTTCEFIKWELTLNKSGSDYDRFHLSALYGASQHNTNGFIGGGEKIEITGKCTVSVGVNSNPQIKVYTLAGKNFDVPFLLAKMDENILHFIDNEKRFIVGNGGWGYVLNRIP